MKTVLLFLMTALSVVSAFADNNDNDGFGDRMIYGRLWNGVRYFLVHNETQDDDEGNHVVFRVTDTTLDRDALIMVGDIDLAKSKEIIKERFSDMRKYRGLPNLADHVDYVCPRLLDRDIAQDERSHRTPNNYFLAQAIANAFLHRHSPLTPNPKFRIFLCLGQSNMQGNAGIESKDKRLVPRNFEMMAAVDFKQQDRALGHWYRAVPPLCREETGLSPVDYFGRALTDSLPKDCRIGIINVAIPSARIATFLQDSIANIVDNAPEWQKSVLAQYGNNPYRHLVELARLAQQEGVISGILLHQGESDCGDEQWPQRVKTVYENLIRDLGLDASNTPLLVGEMLSKEHGGICAAHNSQIAKLAEILPAVRIISSAGCTADADRVHFDAAGYREMGRRYAQAYLSTLEK